MLFLSNFHAKMISLFYLLSQFAELPIPKTFVLHFKLFYLILFFFFLFFVFYSHTHFCLGLYNYGIFILGINCNTMLQLL